MALEEPLAGQPWDRIHLPHLATLGGPARPHSQSGEGAACGLTHFSVTYRTPFLM